MTVISPVLFWLQKTASWKLNCSRCLTAGSFCTQRSDHFQSSSNSRHKEQASTAPALHLYKDGKSNTVQHDLNLQLFSYSSQGHQVFTHTHTESSGCTGLCHPHQIWMSVFAGAPSDTEARVSTALMFPQLSRSHHQNTTLDSCSWDGKITLTCPLNKRFHNLKVEEKTVPKKSCLCIKRC